MNRIEVSIHSEDSVEGSHTMRFRAGAGGSNLATIRKNFRRSLTGLAEAQVARAKGALASYRVIPGSAEDDYEIEYCDASGAVVRRTHMWLTQRPLASSIAS